MKIKDFFEMAGGEMQVATYLGLNQTAVSMWKTRGVPMRYWEALKKKYKLSVDDLYGMTAGARDESRRLKKLNKSA